jgi:hypothetical protein
MPRKEAPYLAAPSSVLKKLNSTSERAEASEASTRPRSLAWNSEEGCSRSLATFKISKGLHSLARARSPCFLRAFLLKIETIIGAKKGKIRSFLAFWPQQSSFFRLIWSQNCHRIILERQSAWPFYDESTRKPLFGTLGVQNGVLLRHI